MSNVNAIVANWDNPFCRIAFLCRVCNKEMNIKYRGNWKAHFNTHTDVKPFKCNVCGKDFAQKIQLQKHGKTHETSNLYSLLPNANIVIAQQPQHAPHTLQN